MAASEMSVFFPSDISKESFLGGLVDGLSLTPDELKEGFPFEFTAQRRDASGYLLIEYDSDVDSIVEELLEWEKPTPAFKEMLSNCSSSLTIHYRGIEHARACLAKLVECVGQAAARCVMENGKGCLLNLAEVVTHISADDSWTWEREEFPELVGVAPSEWLD